MDFDGEEKERFEDEDLEYERPWLDRNLSSTGLRLRGLDDCGWYVPEDPSEESREDMERCEAATFMFW